MLGSELNNDHNDDSNDDDDYDHSDEYSDEDLEMALADLEDSTVFISIIPLLIPILKRRINAYHEMFSLPLIAEQWEETLSRSFEELGHKTSWEPTRSHKVGEDMRLQNIENSRISCKSGVFVMNRKLQKECVKFSGSRTTSYSTLDKKLEHLSNNHDDYYFMLSKNKKFDKKYNLLIFSSDICTPNKLIWSETASKKQWEGTGTFTAEISKSMSAQLWTTVPLELVTYKYDIDCSK